MNRTNRLLAALLAACLALSGCAAPQSDAGAASAPTQSQSSAQSAEAAPARPAASGTLRIISGPGGPGSNAAADNGLYTLETGEGGGCTLLFLDYASNQQTQLCAAPNCAHDSAACTAYVDTSGGITPGLLCDGEQLYLVFGSSADGSEPARVEVMEPDGSGRRVLARFSSGQEPDPDLYAADGSFLYLMLSETGADGRFKRSLCALDKASGELSPLMDAPEDTGFWLVGAYDRSLLVKTIDSRNVHHLSRLDADAPAGLEELASWRLSRQYGVVDGDCLYLYDYDTKCFTRQSFSDGQTRELPNPEGLPFESLYSVRTIGGKAFLTADLAEGGVARSSNFCLDFTSGQIRELNLLDNMGRPLTVCGTSGDRVYVIDQYVTRQVQESFGGIVSTVERVTPHYAWLSTADFWAGSANYNACQPAA